LYFSVSILELDLYMFIQTQDPKTLTFSFVVAEPVVNIIDPDQLFLQQETRRLIDSLKKARVNLLGSVGDVGPSEPTHVPSRLAETLQV